MKLEELLMDLRKGESLTFTQAESPYAIRISRVQLSEDGEVMATVVRYISVRMLAIDPNPRHTFEREIRRQAEELRRATE